MTNDICIPTDFESYCNAAIIKKQQASDNYDAAVIRCKAKMRKDEIKRAKLRALEQPLRLDCAKIIVGWTRKLEDVGILEKLRGAVYNDIHILGGAPTVARGRWNIELRVNGEPGFIFYERTGPMTGNTIGLCSIEETADVLPLEILLALRNHIETNKIWDSIKKGVLGKS